MSVATSGDDTDVEPLVATERLHTAENVLAVMIDGSAQKPQTDNRLRALSDAELYELLSRWRNEKVVATEADGNEGVPTRFKVGGLSPEATKLREKSIKAEILSRLSAEDTAPASAPELASDIPSERRAYVMSRHLLLASRKEMLDRLGDANEAQKKAAIEQWNRQHIDEIRQLRQRHLDAQPHPVVTEEVTFTAEEQQYRLRRRQLIERISVVDDEVARQSLVDQFLEEEKLRNSN